MKNRFYIRVLDIIISTIALVVFAPPIILLFVVCTIDTGSPLFLQQRVGRNMKPFYIIKFRTMKQGTPTMPTHLLSKDCISSIGCLIRKSKLDEILQFINVLRGDMSIVGPRPCLISQVEIIDKRSKIGLYELRPGITGLAQINNIDMYSVDEMIRLDKKQMNEMSTKNYLRTIIKTLSYIIHQSK